MATTSFGYTDSDTTSLSIAVPTLSYAKDFSVKSETAREVVLVNTTTPLDQPETLRFAYQDVANIYSGTGIDPSLMSVTKRGISLVVQLNDILRVTPDDDKACCDSVIELPISCHTVVRVPLNTYVTADVVAQVLRRQWGGFYEGDNTSGRLNSLLRGALKPSTM